MAAMAQKKKMDEFIADLIAKGVLNEGFYEVRELQNENSPNFVTEILTDYYISLEHDMEEIKKDLNQSPVDYERVQFHAQLIYESNLTIGVSYLNLVTTNVIEAGKEFDFERCTEKLDKLADEFRYIKFILDSIMEMERKILTFNKKHE